MSGICLSNIRVVPGHVVLSRLACSLVYVVRADRLQGESGEKRMGGWGRGARCPNVQNVLPDAEAWMAFVWAGAVWGLGRRVPVLHL